MTRIYERRANGQRLFIEDGDLYYRNEERSITVYEPEPGWRNTGLLDAGGNPLRVREGRRPIGFLAKPE